MFACLTLFAQVSQHDHKSHSRQHKAVHRREAKVVQGAGSTVRVDKARVRGKCLGRLRRTEERGNEGGEIGGWCSTSS